jgi:hypothetical protein
VGIKRRFVQTKISRTKNISVIFGSPLNHLPVVSWKKDAFDRRKICEFFVHPVSSRNS